jgi:hypothetical protein
LDKYKYIMVVFFKWVMLVFSISLFN